jgi:hypothetical protein
MELAEEPRINLKIERNSSEQTAEVHKKARNKPLG